MHHHHHRLYSSLPPSPPFFICIRTMMKFTYLFFIIIAAVMVCTALAADSDYYLVKAVVHHEEDIPKSMWDSQQGGDLHWWRKWDIANRIYTGLADTGAFNSGQVPWGCGLEMLKIAAQARGLPYDREETHIYYYIKREDKDSLVDSEGEIFDDVLKVWQDLVIKLAQKNNLPAEEDDGNDLYRFRIDDVTYSFLDTKESCLNNSQNYGLDHGCAPVLGSSCSNTSQCGGAKCVDKQCALVNAAPSAVQYAAAVAVVAVALLLAVVF